MTQRVKVLHVLGRMEIGGTELRLLEMVERMPPDEFDVDFCALSGEEGSLESRVTNRGGSVLKVPLDRAFAVRFPRLLRRHRYTVVHSHVFYASGFILALAAAAGVPRRIAHFRAMSDGKPSTFGRRIEQTILRRLLDASATDVVGCAEGVLDAVWQSRWRQDPRCQVIYNGIDADRFRLTVGRDDVRDELGLPRDALVFVHVGYDAEEKNHPRLLKIFAEIRRRAPGARLVLAGDGTDCPDRVVFRHIREFALQDSVDALGVRRDIPRLLAAADVLLLPSLAEGLPGVVLEACAAGVPVLATDLPGVREIAARLPAVHYLSLAEDDREWARTALSLPGEARALRLRETAAAVFRHSVFDVDRAVVAHRALWCRRSSTGGREELPA